MSLGKDHLYAITVLGALLHDIGKLGWRGEEESKSTHSHEYYSKEFVKCLPTPTLENGTQIDMGKLADVVYSHHREKGALPHDLSQVMQFIKEADYDASGSEREGSAEENPRAPLQSVFKKLCICPDREDHALKRSIYAPKIFTVNSIFPDDTPLPSSLSQKSKYLWDALIKGCKGLPRDVESYVDTLIALLKKYTFFTLSAGYRAQPTVPLFDHLKATAACASALYKYCERSNMSPVGVEKPYALIVGDISGIQDFIFNVHSPEASRKGTAKRLRGRSLEVQFIMEGAAKRILEKYGLPECNLLWCTGGQFAILAPAYAADDYGKVATELNKELWSKFGDALYLAIGAFKCALDAEGDFMKALREAQRDAELKKGRRFYEVLEGEGSPLTNPKLVDTGSIKRCPLCWRDIPSGSVSEDGICKNCSEQEELGGKLANADYLFIGSAPGAPSDFSFAGYSFCLLSSEKLCILRGGAKGTLYKINDSEFMAGEAIPGISRSFKFMGVTMPKHEGDVMSFDILSQLSKGADKLGIAKGDVDNLGYIMHSGIVPVKIWSATMLSSLLDAFFAGYLNEILSRFVTYRICEECAGKLRKEDYLVVKTEIGDVETKGGMEELRFAKWWVLEDESERRRIEATLCERCRESKTPVIYINYSGGDDFLIIGPWDATMKALAEIRDEFGKFVSDHPDMGLSVGYELTESKYPIAVAAKELSSKLSEAKGYRARAYKNSALHRKDMIYVLGDCVNLSEAVANGEGARPYRELLHFGRKLEEGIEKKELPRGFVHDLIQLWQESFKEYAKDPERLEKTRREVRRYMPILKYKIRRNLEKEAMPKYDQPITDFMPWIIVPASWALLRSRLRSD